MKCFEIQEYIGFYENKNEIFNDIEKALEYSQDIIIFIQVYNDIHDIPAEFSEEGFSLAFEWAVEIDAWLGQEMTHFNTVRYVDLLNSHISLGIKIKSEERILLDALKATARIQETDDISFPNGYF